MRFLGGKWQKKNEGRGKRNKMRPFARGALGLPGLQETILKYPLDNCAPLFNTEVAASLMAEERKSS